MDTALTTSSATTVDEPLTEKRIRKVIESRLLRSLAALANKLQESREDVVNDAVSRGWELMKTWVPEFCSFEQRLVAGIQFWISDRYIKCYRRAEVVPVYDPVRLEELPGDSAFSRSLRPVELQRPDGLHQAAATGLWLTMMSMIASFSELERESLLTPSSGLEDAEIAEKFCCHVSTVRMARRRARARLIDRGFSLDI